MSREFEIADVAFWPLVFTVCIAVFCLLPVLVIWHYRKRDRIAAVAMYLGMAVCFAISGVFVWFAVGQAFSSIEITDTELRFDVPLYGRAVPLDRVRTESVEVLSRLSDSGYNLTLRTNGLGMPGFLLGWFDTRAQGRVLVALTVPDTVIAIPTDDGFTILASVDDAEGLTRALREAGGAAP